MTAINIITQRISAKLPGKNYAVGGKMETNEGQFCRFYLGMSEANCIAAVNRFYRHLHLALLGGLYFAVFNVNFLSKVIFLKKNIL